MDAKRVIEAYWARMEVRDWDGVAELLAEDAVVEWPDTAERFVGREAYVRVNREYPEGWSIRVLRVVADTDHSDQVVSEIEVPQKDVGVFRAASFFTVRDGLIVSATEYWTTVGGEAPPVWRAGMSAPTQDGDAVSRSAPGC
jgi:ketosteroid isomerase-like protein